MQENAALENRANFSRIFTETISCSLSGCRCTAEKARDRSSGVIPPAPQAAGIARGGQAVYGVIMEA
jgi:hypothetical protein